MAPGPSAHSDTVVIECMSIMLLSRREERDDEGAAIRRNQKQSAAEWDQNQLQMLVRQAVHRPGQFQHLLR